MRKGLLKATRSVADRLDELRDELERLEPQGSTVVSIPRLLGIGGTPDRNDANSASLSSRYWARLDSNQGPTDYESAALTS